VQDDVLLPLAFAATGVWRASLPVVRKWVASPFDTVIFPISTETFRIRDASLDSR
jgi:hypothetical protein